MLLVVNFAYHWFLLIFSLFSDLSGFTEGEIVEDLPENELMADELQAGELLEDDLLQDEVVQDDLLEGMLLEDESVEDKELQAEETRNTDTPLTLAALARKAVLSLPRKVLDIVAATVLMQEKRKEFEKRSQVPIIENPFCPGHIVDIVAYPEPSESGDYFCSSFYDVTHSVTKFRSNATKGNNRPGILGGFLECWEFVAAEGKTPLTMSILKDSPDMMSFSLAKRLFCQEVEARMRCQAREHTDVQMRRKFLATANACEWVRVYTMTFMEPGISAHARAQALIWLQEFWQEKYNVMAFPPGSEFGQRFPLGIWSHTFSAVAANIFLRLIFPSTTVIGAVNSRAIATSQYNESAFSELSKMSESVFGTPPGPVVDSMLSRLVQRKILALKDEKPYSFRSSARSVPVYDFSFHERESDRLLAAVRNDHGPDEGSSAPCNQPLGIVVKDHAADSKVLRSSRDAFRCGKTKSAAPTRMAGPRFFGRIRPEVQILQNDPSLSLSAIDEMIESQIMD